MSRQYSLTALQPLLRVGLHINIPQSRHQTVPTNPYKTSSLHSFSINLSRLLSHPQVLEVSTMIVSAYIESHVDAPSLKAPTHSDADATSWLTHAVRSGSILLRAPPPPDRQTAPPPPAGGPSSDELARRGHRVHMAPGEATPPAGGTRKNTGRLYAEYLLVSVCMTWFRRWQCYSTTLRSLMVLRRFYPLTPRAIDLKNLYQCLQSNFITPRQ